MSGGGLIGGVIVPVPGRTVIGPHDAAWAHLGIGDRRKRTGKPHMIILHTTKGDEPQVIKEGIGPAGRAQRTAEFWSGDPTYSGAHIVVGSDGVIGWLADSLFDEAYHATVSNAFSIGIEIYQEPGGVIWTAAIEGALDVCDVLCEHHGIPRQFPSREYKGSPLKRLATDGGKTAYGVFGHRDNTDRRGKGDPGNYVFQRAAARGYEGMDYDAGEDLAAGERRQKKLNSFGAQLLVDKLFGATSCEAMRHYGFASGRELDAAVERPLA